MSAGGCWCDDQCVDFGDCCTDAAEVCAVDECVDDDGCPAGQSCISDGSVTDCISECSAPCPHGFRLAPNSAGLAFCVAEGDTCALDGVTMPPGSQPYCHYVDDGYFGFYWEACPAGTEFRLGGDGAQLCRAVVPALPAGAAAYCQYVSDGYFGYAWELAGDPEHVCPASMRYAPNGEGTGFCLIEFDTSPGRVVPRCDPAAAYLGFEWNASCE